MSRATSAPSVAAGAATEATRSVVSIGVMVLLVIFVVIPMLPWAAKQAVKETVESAKQSATDLGDAACPVGVSCLTTRKWLDRQADTVSPPTSVPYGPPNGPVRPLPSQLPTVSAPPARGNLPELGGSTGGGLLGDLPAIGPVVAGGLKALGPGLKALTAP